MKTNDEKIISHMDGKNVNEYIRKLVELDMKGLFGKATLKDQKLKEEIKHLQIRNKIDMIQYLKIEPSLAQEVHMGRMSIDEALGEHKTKDSVPDGLADPKEISPEWEHFCNSIGRKIVFDRKTKPDCHLCGATP
jgi:hypothetical protein